MNTLIFAERAKSSFSVKVVDVVHAVFDVVRRLYLVDLELGFGPIQLREKRFEQGIAPGRGMW